MKSSSGVLPAALVDYFSRTTVALALSDTSNDVPLVLVNEPFCRLTGYSASEVVGRNCRFLQGADTDEESKAAIHHYIHENSADAGRFPIVNYRKDGSTFQNLVFITRLRDFEGTTRYFLASQFDMSSARVRARIGENDRTLSRNLGDIETIGREFGLAMEGSAKILSDSVAMIARLALDADR